MRKTIALVLAVALVAGSNVEQTPADARSNPHAIQNEPPGDVCLACHTNQPPTYSDQTRHALEPDWAALRLDGKTMCEACHDSENMHMVGVVIDFPTPKDLPLDAENKVTCLTCHYAHGNLMSDRPWAAVSFMERMLNDDDMHKSYLLRRNNSSGELCLVCHKTEGEAKHE